MVNQDAHYMGKSLWTSDPNTYMCFFNLLPDVVFHLAFIIDSTILGRLSSRFWNVAVRIILISPQEL